MGAKRSSAVGGGRFLQNKKGNKMKMPVRDSVISKQLKNFGKVGGFLDKRIGIKDNNKTDDEKAFQRHIIERMRQLEENNSMKLDENDPINRAAFGSPSKPIMSDEEDDIEASIVDEEFFSSGSTARGASFKEKLAAKIALSKSQKLKRVEENEEQRDRLTAADKDWSQNIRFMLAKMPTIKSKRVTYDLKENRTNVVKMLEMMTVEKRIPPADAVQDDSETFDKQVLNLQSLLDQRISSAVDKFESTVTCEDESDPKKAVGYVLRLMLKMPEYERNTFTFLADQLRRAKFRGLKDVIHYLLLCQLVLEHCQSKFIAYTDATSLQPAAEFKDSCFYCPELIQTLTRMMQLAVVEEYPTETTGQILVLQSSMSQEIASDYDQLELKLADPLIEIPNDRQPLLRLSCLHRLFVLIQLTVDHCSAALPYPVCSLLFDSLRQIIQKLPQNFLPKELIDRLNHIKQSIETIVTAPTPQSLFMSTRLSVLSNQHEASNDTKTLKKFGLIPQLEPRFEERIDPRQPKNNTGVRRSLQRKVARERRGAMREVRRDGRFLAEHQRKLTRANDEMREKKTRAIISSMRSIDD